MGRREVVLKLDECEMAINSEIKNKINPLDSNYFWQGKKLEIESTRELQNELSKILDSIYTKRLKYLMSSSTVMFFQVKEQALG